jgi:hypothetical protein
MVIVPSVKFTGTTKRNKRKNYMKPDGVDMDSPAMTHVVNNLLAGIKPVKTIKDESLKDVINYGMYSLKCDDNICYKCNVCGEDFELPMDVLEHIIRCHMDDILPDVLPW